MDTYIRRALTHCSTWPLTDTELEHVTQTLINNGYSNQEVQERVRVNINKWYANPTQKPPTQEIKLFYRAYFHKNHKQDEAAIRKIINENVAPTEEDTKINLNIYYKNKRTSELLLKNNPAPHLMT